MDTLTTPIFSFPNENPTNTLALNTMSSSWLNDSTFQAFYDVNNSPEILTNIDVTVNGAVDRVGNTQQLFQTSDLFSIYKKSTNVLLLSASENTISRVNTGVSGFHLTVVFDEIMDTSTTPTFVFPIENPLNTLSLNMSTSQWSNDHTFEAMYDVNASSEVLNDIDVEVSGALDRIGNPQQVFQEPDLFNIDTKVPGILTLTTNIDTISPADVGVSNFVLTAVFDELMNTVTSPVFDFPNEDPLNTLSLNAAASGWLNDSSYQAFYDVADASEFVSNIDVEVNGGSDLFGNPQPVFQESDVFTIDTKSPGITQLTASIDTISLADVGLSTFMFTVTFDEVMDTLISPALTFPNENPQNTITINAASSSWLDEYTFMATCDVNTSSEVVMNIDVDVTGAFDRVGNPQLLFQEADLFNIDTKLPALEQITVNVDTISLADAGTSTFLITTIFDEAMDISISPSLTFPNENPLNTISFNSTASSWLNDSTYITSYDVINSSELVIDIDVDINNVADRIGNLQSLIQESNLFSIDTKPPGVEQITANIDTISLADVGASTFELTVIFDEVMDTLISPAFEFPNEDPLNTISLNIVSSNWSDDSTYIASYDVANSSELLEDIDVEISGASDRIGNTQLVFLEPDLYNIDTKSPSVAELLANIDTITRSDTGVASFSIRVTYDKKMDNASIPAVSFPVEDPLLNTLTPNLDSSRWQNDSTYISWFNVSDSPESLFDIDVQVDQAKDKIGNLQNIMTDLDLFNIHTKQPELISIIPSIDTITYADTGVSTFFLAFLF